MLNPFIMAMVDTVLFLTFMGQRQGIHSLTELNDLHRFFDVADRRISRKESFTVFRINLRDFSTLNQKYGHQYGDEYLYHFASGLDKLFPFHLCCTVNANRSKCFIITAIQRDIFLNIDTISCLISLYGFHIITYLTF